MLQDPVAVERVLEPLHGVEVQESLRLGTLAERLHQVFRGQLGVAFQRASAELAGDPRELEAERVDVARYRFERIERQNERGAGQHLPGILRVATAGQPHAR